MSEATPCIAVCIIDPDSNLCMGCGRTVAEITGWRHLEACARHAIMAALPERMIDAGLRPAAAAEPVLTSDAGR